MTAIVTIPAKTEVLVVQQENRDVHLYKVAIKRLAALALANTKQKTPSQPGN